MNLSKNLNINKDIISIVGGGGKTTILKKIAFEQKMIGKSVLITTTTAMNLPEISDYIVEGEQELIAKKGAITFFYKERVHGDKVKGFEGKEMEDRLENVCFDLIICEADGAKRKPIKAPREDEPLILKKSTIVIGVIGMSCYGKKLDENYCHRTEFMKKLTKERIINDKLFVDLIGNKDGLFKNAGKARRILLLNQCDTVKVKEKAEHIIELLNNKKVETMCTVSFKTNRIYCKN